MPAPISNIPLGTKGLMAPPNNVGSTTPFASTKGLVPPTSLTLGVPYARNANPNNPAQNTNQSQSQGGGIATGGSQNTNSIDYNANPYYLRPGESTQQYQQRVGTIQGSQNQNTTPPPQPNTNPYQSTTPTFPGLVGSLASTAMQPTPQYTAAQNQYLQANQALADLNKQYAQQGYNIGTSRTNLAEATGEQGALQGLYTGQEQALTQEMQAAQAAAQTATGQQGVQQSGLAAAGGLASPVPAQALGFYNPATGEFTQYGGGQGQSGAFGAGQVLGNVALGQQFQQTLAPAYNAANALLNGTEATTGKMGLNEFLQKNPDVNPTSLNAANFVNQWVNNQFSNPKYQELGNYLNEFLQTLTPLIGAAGMTTNFKQQIVNSMVNSTASGQSISQVLGNLFNNIASAKFGSIYETGQQPTIPSMGGQTGAQGNIFGGFFRQKNEQ